MATVEHSVYWQRLKLDEERKTAEPIREVRTGLTMAQRDALVRQLQRENILAFVSTTVKP